MIKDNKEFQKIYDELKTENPKIKLMLASKQFYRTHPELKPEPRQKRPKPPVMGIEELLETHGDDKMI